MGFLWGADRTASLSVFDLEKRIRGFEPLGRASQTSRRKTAPSQSEALFHDRSMRTSKMEVGPFRAIARFPKPDKARKLAPRQLRHRPHTAIQSPY